MGCCAFCCCRPCSIAPPLHAARAGERRQPSKSVASLLSQDVVAAEQRQQLAAAQAAAAAAESRADGAEERQQQLEVALNESHSALQQRNAELALVMKVRLGRTRYDGRVGSSSSGAVRSWMQ